MCSGWNKPDKSAHIVKCRPGYEWDVPTGSCKQPPGGCADGKYPTQVNDPQAYCWYHAGPLNNFDYNVSENVVPMKPFPT